MDAMTVIAFCSALLLLVTVAIGVMVWLLLDLWRATGSDDMGRRYTLGGDSE